MIHLAQLIQAVKDKDNMALYCTHLLPSCLHQLCMHLTPQQSVHILDNSILVTVPMEEHITKWIKCTVNVMSTNIVLTVD